MPEQNRKTSSSPSPHEGNLIYTLHHHYIVGFVSELRLVLGLQSRSCQSVDPSLRGRPLFTISFVVVYNVVYNVVGGASQTNSKQN